MQRISVALNDALPTLHVFIYYMQARSLQKLIIYAIQALRVFWFLCLYF